MMSIHSVARRVEARWTAVRFLASLLRAYRDEPGLRHRLLTALFEKLVAEMECADSALLQEVQLLKLRKLLRCAMRVPWWRERLVGAGLAGPLARLEQIAALPVVTKSSFAGIPRRNLLSSRIPDRRLIFRRTSGTTGAPFEWGHDRNTFYVEINAHFLRFARWHVPAIKRRGRRALFATFFLSSYGVPRVLVPWEPAARDTYEQCLRAAALLRQEGPPVFYASPGMLLLFASRLRELRQEIPIRLAVCAGERVQDAVRDSIAQALNCPVVAQYGSVEAGLLAVECPMIRAPLYHINASRVYIELTDKEGRVVPEGGSGFVTVTSLDNRAMPLIRYQLGDIARFVRRPCPCGRTMPLIEIEGKNMDFIRLRRGQSVPFAALNALIINSFFGQIELYQVVQPSLDALTIRLRLKQTDRTHFESRFLRAVRRTVGDTLAISLEYPDAWDVRHGSKLRVFVPLGEHN